MVGQWEGDDVVHNKFEVEEIRAEIQIISQQEDIIGFWDGVESVIEEVVDVYSYVADEKVVEIWEGGYLCILLKGLR